MPGKEVDNDKKKTQKLKKKKITEEHTFKIGILD
jgi:hypothetical protein